MSAYKDKTQGTWYVSFRYIDWTGKKTQKLKRGFKTKKEALNYEKEFIRKTAADMKMEMNSFIQVYFEDKKNELKENSIRNKQHMMNKHIVPYFGTRKMNEITPAEIIQWQNTIQEKGYSKTYERMIQNQLNALFNHAQKIYNLKENPCKKVKKMGKSDANKLEFWTKAEYDRFIAGISGNAAQTGWFTCVDLLVAARSGIYYDSLWSCLFVHFCRFAKTAQEIS